MWGMPNIGEMIMILLRAPKKYGFHTVAVLERTFNATLLCRWSSTHVF